MKIFKRLMALMLVLLMCVSMLSVIACNKDDGNDTNTGTNTDTSTDTSTNTSTGDTNNPDGTVDYFIQTKTVGGMALGNVTLAIYENGSMKEFGTTDKDGFLTITLPKGNYIAKVREAQKGYTYKEEGYALNEVGTVITLASSLIDSTSMPTSTLVLGQVMNDLKFTDVYGKEYRLSDLYKGPDGVLNTEDDKKMILLNFFYTDCGPCVNEIPYLLAAYEEYKDEIEIVGIDPYSDDDALKIKLFAEGAVGSNRDGQEPMTFPLVDAPLNWAMAIADAEGSFAYPTNIIIDRYGVVTLIEKGGITSQTPFNLMFEFFTKDKYVQTLVTDMEQITPTEEPDVEMPSSDEIGQAVNSGDITIEYTGDSGEMAWPFIIGEDEKGNKYIYASNTAEIGSPKINSYSQINMKVSLEAGQALAFDYFAAIGEEDIVYIFAEGKDIFTISGVSEEWEKCYSYVAEKDGEYEVSVIYMKDIAAEEDPENDGIMIDNVRVVDASEIDKATYISYYAAKKKNDKGEFTEFVTLVLGDDGFYHVDTKDGPLLLVEMISSTQFSKIHGVSTLLYGSAGYELKTFTNEELLRLELYANCSINGDFYGLCPVTEELKGLLIKIANEYGDSDNENEWLELCEYYGAYGTTKQLDNPIKGLADFCAFDTAEKTEENKDAVNYVKYDKAIMPKGYLFKFVPTKSGVYRITSDSSEIVEGYVFLDSKKTVYDTADKGERLAYLYTNNDPKNCTMAVYMEQGKSYYIDIAYKDPTMTGSFTFTVEYVAEEFNYFIIASQVPFTTDLGDDIDSGNSSSDDEDISNMMGSGIIAGGVDVILGTDDIYYVLGTHATMEEAKKASQNPEDAYACTDPTCKQCYIIARNYYTQLTLKVIRNLYERCNEDDSVTAFNVKFRDDVALANAIACIKNYVIADEAELETRALSVAQTFSDFVTTRLQRTNYIDAVISLIEALVIDQTEADVGKTLVASEIAEAFDTFEASLKSFDTYYHSIGSKLYADFLLATGVFNEKSLKQVIDAKGFDLGRTGDDQQVLAWISGFEVEYIIENLSAELKGTLTKDELVSIINGKTESENTALLDKIEELRAAYQANDDIVRGYFKKLWENDYDENYATYQVEDVLNGIYHGQKSPSANDQYILDKIEEFKGEYGEQWKLGFIELWGDDYTTNYEEVYKVDDVASGKYHGEPILLTDEAMAYYDKMLNETTHPDNPELHGCVVVDKELAELLQILMDKFTFKGVEHSWTKLCYYYIHLKG